MNKKRICIIGHFGEGRVLLNGQTVKTKTVRKYLDYQFGRNEIIQIDTHKGKKGLLAIIFKLIKAIICCDNLIILPAQNGIKVVAPVLWFCNLLFSKKLHYIVIGGWLPNFIKNNMLLSTILKKFDYIYVETSVMEKSLCEQGFNNVVVMPNCKDLNIISEEELIYSSKEPYKLCTFSRVMVEKGIEDAILAVQEVNNFYGRIVYELDIYGNIENGQENWFDTLRRQFPSFINYKGSVSYDKSAEVLKEYYALLFPTHFFTEGIPGTIIDAYAAGIPVICSNWESCKDIVDDKKTGIVFEFENNIEFVQILKELVLKPIELNDCKLNCLTKAKAYLPENVLNNLAERIS